MDAERVKEIVFAVLDEMSEWNHNFRVTLIKSRITENLLAVEAAEQEPKSKLEELRRKLGKEQYPDEGPNRTTGEVLYGLLTHLIVKEKEA